MPNSTIARAESTFEELKDRFPALEKFDIDTDLSKQVLKIEEILEGRHMLNTQNFYRDIRNLSAIVEFTRVVGEPNLELDRGILISQIDMMLLEDKYMTHDDHGFKVEPRMSSSGEAPTGEEIYDAVESIVHSSIDDLDMLTGVTVADVKHDLEYAQGYEK